MITDAQLAHRSLRIHVSSGFREKSGANSSSLSRWKDREDLDPATRLRQESK